MPELSVIQLISEGALYADSDIEVVGWVVDRFEHRAIYDTASAAAECATDQGIWLSGALPTRKTARGDGPLHSLRVKIAGKYHWQPRKGAGHFGQFPAWVGVKTFAILEACDDSV